MTVDKMTIEKMIVELTVEMTVEMTIDTMTLKEVSMSEVSVHK